MNKPFLVPNGEGEYLVSVMKFGTPQVLANGVSYNQAIKIRQDYIEKQKINQRRPGQLIDRKKCI